MDITTDMIKALREQTGAGILDCKKALEETSGDIEEAKQILQRKGFAEAEEKRGRVAEEGLVEAYVHSDGRLASLVEVNCETDFVARTDQFLDLAHDLAMQVVARDPQYVSVEDIPDETLEAMRKEIRENIEDEKPEEIIERIVKGKLEAQLDEICLLRQPFIRDEDQTIEQLIKENIAQFGENIKVRRFVRYELGRQ